MESPEAKHILVVDDDITCLDLISFVFQRSGHVVDRCASGEMAIEYVKTILPDLIIIDLLMPGIDGVETIRSIRALGVDKVPILAFTAVEDKDLHAQAKLAGCQSVLTKPCPPNKLLEAIGQLL